MDKEKGEGKDFGSLKLQRKDEVTEMKAAHGTDVGYRHISYICLEADKEFSFRHVKFKMFIRTLVLFFIS